MTNKPMLSERDKFEVFWRKEMNVEAMDLHRCEFPMIAYEDQPYACHETERGRLTWMACAGIGRQPNQPGDPVAVFEIDSSGYRARIVLDPAKPFPSSGTKLYAEQPAPVAMLMPERPYASEDDQETMTDYEIGLGHGACEMWDKIKSLNSTRPDHANPPPGTEPSGTHHDNDGLDEWRTNTIGRLTAPH